MCLPRRSRLVGLLVLLGASARGADNPGGPKTCQLALLHNGFTISYSRRDAAGGATRLYLCAEAGSGYVEFPTEQIEALDQQQIVQPPAPDTPPATAQAAPPARESLGTLVAGAASRHQIDPDFVTSVVKAESGFDPAAVSPKGAQGLMQLMPRTAAGLGVADALDPAANVEAGTKYLRQLLDRYNGDALKALAAYNAGPQPVERYKGVPPYPETRAYITRIIEDYNRKKLEPQVQPTAGK